MKWLLCFFGWHDWECVGYEMVNAGQYVKKLFICRRCPACTERREL